MMSQATCKFCALSDDTIQVICEARCLICSRCQQVPILRKLLIDHTMAIDVSSTATQPAKTYLKGFCPVCEASMSTTMLSLISTYKELYKASEDTNSVRTNSAPGSTSLSDVSFVCFRGGRALVWSWRRRQRYFPHS
jgi:hypothetical protein